MANGTIEQVQLPSGNVYDIVDAGARQLIEALENYSAYLGVTTTPLTDGSTTNPIQIGGQSVTAKHGEIANYGSGEFIWNANLTPAQWQEFGDLSALGDLAYKNSASGSFTPAGSVSQPTFTGNSNTCSVTVANNSSGNYTPAGSVSQPTFSGNELTSTGKFTPAGSVSLTNGNKNTTVSAASSGTTTYQPAGTCSGTAVTLGTKTIQQVKTTGTPTAVTLPTVTVTNKVLTFTAGSVTAGTAMTKEGVTVGSGSVSSITQPTFTGTAVRLVTGNISVPTSASFSGTEGDVSVKGTPTGTVSQPTFSGTKVKISATVTPTGTVSQPTFSGTAGTVTVS